MYARFECSRSFKVIVLCTNRKSIYDFVIQAQSLTVWDRIVKEESHPTLVFKTLRNGEPQCQGYTKRSFYSAVNGIFGKVLNFASEDVILQLIVSKCMPILLYGLHACPVNKTDRRRRRRRRKCDDLKCVRKPTKSRLSLTHHANKSSR